MNDPTIARITDHIPEPRDPAWVEQAITDGRSRCESQIPERFADAVADDERVRQWVTDLVKSAADKHPIRTKIVNGPGLLIIGRVGVGKTHQAYGAVRALSVSGARCSWKFTTAADMYAALRRTDLEDSGTVLDWYLKSNVLVIDDLGAAKDSDWREEVNYRVLDHRYNQNLPTLVTTNVPYAAMDERFGERVASRLLGLCAPMVIKGFDRRRPNPGRGEVA